MRATTSDGVVAEAKAFNEVTLVRHTGQSANVRVSIDGVVRIGKFVGDGLIALTPVSPFRPRRWRGALLPDGAAIEFENLDPGKRPLSATADVKEIFDVVSLSVRVETSAAVTLLFDPGHSLQDRIAAEQFSS